MTFSVSVTLLLQFAFAVVLTLPASAIVLWRYRAAVLDNMAPGARASRDAGAPAPQQRSTRMAQPAADPAAPPEAAAQRRLAVIYTIAGLGAGAVQAILFFRLGDVDANIPRAFVLAWTYAWPVVPTLVTLLVLPGRRAVLLASAYVATGGALLVMLTIASRLSMGHEPQPFANLGGYLEFLALVSAGPLVVLGMLGSSRIRSISSLVLSVLLILAYAYAASQVILVAAVERGSLTATWTAIGPAMTGYLVFMLLALPAGVFGWLGVRGIALGYGRKSFSDVQLLVDTWWIVAIFAGVVELSSEAGWRSLWCLLAFVVYRGTVEIGLRRWPIPRGAGRPRSLLLLRVFGYRSRTERVFDAVARRWRFKGPVLMIGAPDIAARTIEPGNFIAYVGGQFRSRFIHDDDELAPRLAALDRAPDPDGRYRVNELLCADASWRGALGALLERADLVLMDLRGFDRSRQGCRYELGELGRYGLLARTLLLIDPSTDSEFLAELLAEVSREPAAAGQQPTRFALPRGRSAGARMDRVVEALAGFSAATSPVR